MMAVFPSIKIEGGLLGPDLLDQVLGAELPGQRPADFGLDSRRNLTDEIAGAFADARALWGVFQNRLQRLSEEDVATTATRDAWVIPFLGLLGYAPTFNPRAYEIDGLSFAISHRADEAEKAPPVHIVGYRQELGRVPASGRPRLAPHSLVQEFLNRTENLWGVVTNGRILRLLRDCSYIRRQAYVEFDLQAMLDEQRFQDFAALYRLLHRTRLPRTDETARDCLLEKYYEHSIEQGGRVRDRLRDGVEQCIVRLANGFLRHPGSDDLRRRAAPDCADNDRISPEDFYRQLLRLVYRLLFLLVSEDRGLLSTDPLYREHYGVARLRRLLDNQAAFSEHDDLWQSLRVLWYLLNNDTPQPALNNQPMATALGLPVLNGELFAGQPLDNASISNHDLLDGFFYLAKYEPARGAAWQRVNYSALDVEELGSVYESLLEFHPAVQRDTAGRLSFALVFGSERKTTGSYYTPPELVGELIKSALEPVLADRLKASPKDPEKAILSIRVCDPACGSGHFLLAAARRLGKELARVRTGEDEPAPERVREAIRDVVSHCIYGVDKNPLAVDLCRVALWLESHMASKPLTFLDHRIRPGDSLIGVFNLDVLREGIPDEAFRPLEGDDKEVARQLARQNREERADQERGQGRFQWDGRPALADFTQRSRELDAIADDSPGDIRRKRARYEESHSDPSWRRQREVCDLYTAAFFQPLRKGSPAMTSAVLADHLAGRCDPRLLSGARALAEQQQFFHWPLWFPEVFADGGFDVVLGNPPWVSFTGRQKVEISTGLLRALLGRSPAISRWPATHPAFLVLSAELLGYSRRAGLVLPKQVADLAAYGEARAAVTGRGTLASPVVDVGEHAFPGVTQAVGLFTIVTGTQNGNGSTTSWPVAPGKSAQTESANAGPAIRVTDGLERAVASLAEWPRFPPKTFADPGVHTGNVSKKLILSCPPPRSDEYAPIREGRDIAAFVCGPPRKWLWLAPDLEKGEYCTIRERSRYTETPILVRQTADRPIAARHHSPHYFRNSLLACYGIEGVPATVVTAFLNSALYAYLHRAAALDANQKAFPQVKVRHLHSLPAVPVDSISRVFEGRTLCDALDAAALEAESVATLDVRPSPGLLERVERLVLASFDLPTDLAPRLLEAAQ